MTYPKEWLGVKCNCTKDCAFAQLEIVYDKLIDNTWIECISTLKKWDGIVHVLHDDIIPLTPSAMEFLLNMDVDNEK